MFQYVRWYPCSIGNCMQFLDKVTGEYKYVGDYDFLSGPMLLLYGSDPNYAKIYSAEGIKETVERESRGKVKGSGKSTVYDLAGLGIVSKKKTWLYVGIIAGSLVLVYFLYKTFKGK